uniref:E3 ubiquitin-protein ligase MARCHF6 n=1 Tax=Musca domestica TaxID=7370 RepID=T1PIL8_MUSDO
MDDLSQGDICRVCRCEASSDRPLFYPCVCTGSIKYIHQDCLMQWMRYSHKEYCELCGHRFSFQPIYSPDMPRVLPLRDVAGGLLSAIMKAAKSWAHYSLVGLAWFVVVPLSAYRTYRYLFRASSFDMILSLPFDIFSTENLASDVFRGCFVVTCTLLSFIGLVWLREQILLGGGPDWLERDDAPGAGANNDADDEVELNLPPDGGGANANAGDEGQDNVANAQIEGNGAPAVPAEAAAEGDVANNNNDIADGRVNNAEAPPVVEPMNNNAPAVADPVENEGDPPLEFGPQLPPALAANRNNNNNAANPAENDNDEPNWNPMEWDRAAEELTWERLLGLDGSLVFLEHVFWIVSLNTMLIFAFAFCPYCIGHFILSSLDLMDPEKPLLHFHGLITTLFGYCFIGIILVVLHCLARAFHMRRVRSLIGLCYIVVKVSLLSVVEIGVLPLVCGWWLDICSLPLFDATLKDRKTSFTAAPGTSLFVHWMFGMVFVYYFAAFISLLREVLRPGVLWFLRNLNDPDFSPIQEMIHLPILKHVRRLISSAMIFGSVVLLMLWIPIRVLKTIWPTFLPYTLSGDSDVNELSLQLLLLQIVLPGFFEQSHTRVWLKKLLRIWCICVSWVLGIRSYLLGADPEPANAENANNNDANNLEPQPANEIVANDEPNAENAAQNNAEDNNVAEEPAPVQPPIQAQPPPPPPPPPPQAERNLAAVHHAIIHRDVPVAFQPYDKPTVFPLRLCGLLFFMCISLVIASLVTLTVPVWIGRQVMSLWSVGSITTQVAVQGAEVTPRPHELYTAALGTYLCWMLTRGIAIAVTLLPQGRAAVMDKIKQWLKVGASYALPVLIIVLMLGVIPLLFGMLLELVVVIPVRVGVLQTPIYFIWQDWALGVLYTKIAIALTLMGPDWHLKRALERAYRDGLREIDLKFLITELAMPVITCFGLALAIPYVLAHSILPIFFTDPWVQLEIAHFVYPVFFSVIGAIALIYFQIRQFKKLYVAIKVDKYLVGQRLVNYEHRKKQQEAAEERAARQKEEEEQEHVPIANIVEQAELERRRRQEVERQQLVQDLVRDDLL